MIRFLILVLIFVGFFSLSAETVYLKDGTQLRGTITKQTPDAITIQLDSGEERTISKRLIRRIEHRSEISKEEQRLAEEQRLRDARAKEDEEKRLEEEKQARLKKEAEDRKIAEEKARQEEARIESERARMKRQALLLVAVPGLGQVYLGENERGSRLLAGTGALASLFFSSVAKEIPYRQERNRSFDRMVVASGALVYPLAGYFAHQAQSSERSLGRVVRTRLMAEGLLVGIYAWNFFDLAGSDRLKPEGSSKPKWISFMVPGISQAAKKPGTGSTLLATFAVSSVATLVAYQENAAWRGYYRRTSRDSVFLLTTNSDRGLRDALLIQNALDFRGIRNHTQKSADRFNFSLAVLAFTYAANAVNILFFSGNPTAGNTAGEAGIAIRIPF